MMINFKIGLIAASVLSLSACVAYPAGYYGYNDGYGYGSDAAVVDVAPPAPYVEPVPIAPYVGAVWIGGYWDWVGGRHVWRGGHYEHGRAGYAYHASSWSRDGGGRYHLHRGGWARR